jgi:hypothetical protein
MFWLAESLQMAWAYSVKQPEAIDCREGHHTQSRTGSGKVNVLSSHPTRG